MGQAESTGAVLGKDGGRNSAGNEERLPQGIENEYKINTPITWTTPRREMPENAPVDSTTRAPWGPVDISIRRAFDSSPVNARCPSRDGSSDCLLSEDQVDLSSPESSSSRRTPLRPASLHRTSLRNKRALSPLHTSSRVPSVLSPRKPSLTGRDTKPFITQSSLRKTGNVRSTTSPIRLRASGRATHRWGKSGNFKRHTSAARRANNWATPPTWTTPGPKWKRNAWRNESLRSYSPEYLSSSPSRTPRSAYSIKLRHQRAKQKAECRDRKRKGKQRSQNSNTDEYADFKSVEHDSTTEHNNWYHQHDTAWSSNDKFHGPNIVFPRRFDDPGFNRLNEWWWGGKKGADSHLGLDGWFSTDLLNAYIKSLKQEPEVETAPCLGRNSRLAKSGMRCHDGMQSLCGICGSAGHETRQCECCDACFAFGHAAERCPLRSWHWMQDLATYGLWNGDIEVMAEGSSNDLSSRGSSSGGDSSSASPSEGLSSPNGCVEEWEHDWW